MSEEPEVVSQFYLDGTLYKLGGSGGGGGGGIQVAEDSPIKPTYEWYGTQAQYEALEQYYTEEENDTVYFTIDLEG